MKIPDESKVERPCGGMGGGGGGDCGMHTLNAIFLTLRN